MTSTVLFLFSVIAVLNCQTEAAITRSSSVKTVVHHTHGVHPGHAVTHTVHHPLAWNSGSIYGLPSTGTTSVKTVSHGIHHSGGVSVTSPGGTTVSHTTHGIPHPFGLGYGFGGLSGGMYGLPFPGGATVSHSTHGVPYPFGYGGVGYGGLGYGGVGYGGLGYGGLGYGGLGYGGLGYGVGGLYGLQYPNAAATSTNYGFQPALGFGGPYGFH